MFTWITAFTTLTSENELTKLNRNGICKNKPVVHKIHSIYQQDTVFNSHNYDTV